MLQEEQIIQDFRKDLRDNLDAMAISEAKVQLKSTDYLGKTIVAMRDAVRKTTICRFSNRLHIFNGKYYQRIEKDMFYYILEDIMREIGINASYWSKIDQSCLSETNGKVIQKIPNNLVCFKNGVVDFDMIDKKDFGVKPFSPKYPVLYQLPYEFNPKAKCPMWDNFLENVLPDEKSRQCLQEFWGTIFVDREKSKIELVLWLLGEGANGKGVIFETIKGILGRDNLSNFDLKDLVGGSNREKNIAAINGKLLNYCSDSSKSAIDNSTFKALVSGEPTPAREIYGSPFTAYNIPLMMFNTNKLPSSNDNSFSYKRRFLIIPFNITITEDKQDKNLATKLASEYSGILNWILEGRKRIIYNNFKFTKSQGTLDVTDEYMEASDTVARWILACDWAAKPKDTEEPFNLISSFDFYNEYVRWCSAMKVIQQDIKSFGKQFITSLRDIGFTTERKSEGTCVRVYNVKRTTLRY